MNTLKTTVMIFVANCERMEHLFYFDNYQFEACNSYKYVGIVFNTVQTFSAICLSK